MAISRYRNIELLKVESTGSQYYETSDALTEKQISEIQTFTIRASRFDRLDVLAAKHLGSGEYWWAIALINNIEWAFGFSAGDLIKIPISVEDVLKLL